MGKRAKEKTNQSKIHTYIHIVDIQEHTRRLISQYIQSIRWNQKEKRDWSTLRIGEWDLKDEILESAKIRPVFSIFFQTAARVCFKGREDRKRWMRVSDGIYNKDRGHAFQVLYGDAQKRKDVPIYKDAPTVSLWGIMSEEFWFSKDD